MRNQAASIRAYYIVYTADHKNNKKYFGTETSSFYENFFLFFQGNKYVIRFERLKILEFALSRMNE